MRLSICSSNKFAGLHGPRRSARDKNVRLAAIVSAGLAGLVLLGACGDDQDVRAWPADVAPPVLAGAFDLRTDMQLPATVLAPAAVAELFQDLHATRDDPAGTWFALLKHAGLPQAQQLLDVLPSVLSGKLKGWINESAASHLKAGSADRNTLDALIDESMRLLARFDLLTTLTFDGAAPPRNATHAFAGLEFKIAALNVSVPVPRFLVERSQPLVLETQTGVALLRGAGGVAVLELSDHAFGIPFGEYAWAAINVRQRQRNGLDLRGELGRIFDCARLAGDVASRCVGPVCVGHRAEIQGVCEAGLDRVADSIKAKIIAMNFDAVRFASGTCELLPPKSLAKGEWDASVDMGQGARAVDAWFVGSQRP